jgi:hypothetical protein
MNIETLGTHTIGQLISLYRASALRSTEIFEILEELQDCYESLRLAKADLNEALVDEDTPEEIARYEAKVKAYEADLRYIFDTNIDGLQARARNLAEDTEYGSVKING